MNRLTIRRTLLFLLLAFAMPAVAQDTPETAVAGNWSGNVSTDVGEMVIQVTVTHTAGKFTGTITSPHGKWTIDGGTFEKGRWRLSFKGDSGQGYIAGSIVNGRFTGEWNNVGVARGTFDLGRVKQ